MRIGYLQKDQQERFNGKRGWFVTAWRIVDAAGVDMVQPWSNNKTEARKTAKSLGISLIETGRPAPEDREHIEADSIALLLWDYLKRDPEHKDRRRTGYGTKTKLGLLRTIKGILSTVANG